jgi:hypothetical protein
MLERCFPILLVGPVDFVALIRLISFISCLFKDIFISGRSRFGGWDAGSAQGVTRYEKARRARRRRFTSGPKALVLRPG